MSSDKADADRGARIADNSRHWPALAAVLAPDGGCECQMLALTIAEGFGASEVKVILPASTPRR